MEEGLRYFSPVRNDGNRVAGTDFHHPAHLRLLGRLVTLCGADLGHRWEPLRDDVSVRNQRRWHGLQSHPNRHPLTTLLSFAGTDGAQPYAGLIQATDGNLYGTTKFGGANNDGTIFKITLSGTLTTLHSFDATDGSDPYAALVQDTNGSF